MLILVVGGGREKGKQHKLPGFQSQAKTVVPVLIRINIAVTRALAAVSTSSQIQPMVMWAFETHVLEPSTGSSLVMKDHLKCVHKTQKAS